MPQMIQKFLIQAAIKAIAKQFKLDKVLNYVENDNALDKKYRKLDKRVRKLEKST